jgi:hypothetical protein
MMRYWVVDAESPAAINCGGEAINGTAFYAVAAAIDANWWTWPNILVQSSQSPAPNQEA